MDNSNDLQSNTTGSNLSVINLPNEQVKPVSTMEVIIPVPDPDNLIPRLMKYYTIRIVRGLVAFTLLEICLVIATVVCIVYAKLATVPYANKVESIVCGVIIGSISVFTFLLLLSSYLTLPEECDWMKNTIKIIELNGKTWQCQIEALKNVFPGDLFHPCIYKLYDRLLKRSNGYILVTTEGFVIDELTFYQYDMKVVARVDVMSNPMEKGWILRIFFVRSVSVKNGFLKGNYKLTPVDLFMPTSMQLDEVNEIRQRILLDSYKYLLRSQFFGES